jgi:hypothetical protein
LVEHDVEAEEFEAAIRFLGLTTAVSVLQLWLHGADSFDNDFLYLAPDFGRVATAAGFASALRRLC